jgi:hypothetical protein
MRKFSDKSSQENQSTHFIFDTFLPKICHYEMTWKNTVQPDRPQMTTEYGECGLHVDN